MVVLALKINFLLKIFGKFVSFLDVYQLTIFIMSLACIGANLYSEVGASINPLDRIKKIKN